MHTFDQIELFLDGTYPIEDQKLFIFKSRCICNFLERALRERQFNTEYSRLNIHCTKNNVDSTGKPLKGTNFFEVRINQNIPSVSTIADNGLQKCFMSVIKNGLEAAEKFMPLPTVYCLETLHKFEEGGFKNEWIQAEKNWKHLGIKSKVIANLTLDKFILTQEIIHGDAVILEIPIIETKPREMLFLDYLGSLSINSNGEILYKKSNKIITRYKVNL